MKKLIRSRATHAFLAKQGGWTENIMQAREIGQLSEAALIKCSLGLKNVEVYYSFADDGPGSPTNFSVPLD